MGLKQEIGVCAVCGDSLIRTAEDCWHPWGTGKNCPPEPAKDDLTGWQRFYDARLGMRVRRPGRDAWRPA